MPIHDANFVQKCQKCQICVIYENQISGTRSITPLVQISGSVKLHIGDSWGKLQKGQHT